MAAGGGGGGGSGAGWPAAPAVLLRHYAPVSACVHARGTVRVSGLGRWFRSHVGGAFIHSIIYIHPLPIGLVRMFGRYLRDAGREAHCVIVCRVVACWLLLEC